MGKKQMTKILIVEDESIVAKNIQNRLKRLGYTVPAIVSSGEEAIRKSEEIHPDLVLMDIVLKGGMDGVEAAEEIRARFNIPIIYLTAYTDDNTLQRAKVTEPFGYLLKPFEIRGLHSAIEMALYKHNMERKLKDSKRRLATTLKSIGDGVITTDTEGFVTFMNPTAEALTGWKQEYALGKDLGEVFNIVNEETRTLTENPVTKAIREDVIVSLADNTTLIARDGRETPIDVSAAPIRDDKGNIAGVVLAFRTERKRVEAEISKAQKLESSVGDRRENTSIKLIVATSSTLVREGIRKMLEPEEDIEIVAETSNYLEVIPLVEQKKPEVLFIDTALLNLNIGKILESIRGKNSETKVLLLLRALDEEFIIDAISLGVRGCLTDTSNAEQFIEAIKTVCKNEIWAEVKVITKVLTQLLPPRKGNMGLLKSNLTKREREIVKLVVQSYSNKKISSNLFISERTVKTHLKNIFKKLGVNNRLQLIIKFQDMSISKP